MRVIALATAVAALALLGFSCKNKFVSVNVNTNAVAKSVTNAVNAVNSDATKQVVTREAAVAAAKAVFIQQESKGIDFSKGPCLTEVLLPDWVADVAHNPRQPVDDEPANQCTTYRTGAAHHFVELDPEGQLIRAQ